MRLKGSAGTVTARADPAVPGRPGATVPGRGTALAQLAAACSNVAYCFVQRSDEEDEKLP